MERFIIESEEVNYNECNECHMKRRPSKKNQQICIICYQAKLLYKQSGNETIDEFIKYTQINFIQESSRMKFISYDRFKNIEFIKEGGFSKIYKATWIDGPHSWNEEKEDFEYKEPNIIVALKQLNNSENILLEELKENYITKSKDFYNIEWNKKLKILRNIAVGLKHLHNKGIIHRDLHSGNILCENDDDVVISDLGISKSAMGSTNDNESVYGIIPYMAPEILQRKKYTICSDIYSFGMIMWELMTGKLPFEDQTIDVGLMSKICYDGLLPPITANAPKGYIELMQECWNSDPIKRPEAANILNERLRDMLSEEVSNPTEIIKPTDIAPIDNPKSKQLSNEIFTSSSKELEPLYPKKRMIENNLIEDTNCGYCYKTKANEFDIKM
ncbi:kinase-like domain-containing protein [Rhizophagus irregularis DAOM 181602=DAOM 197198]|nr:kinase-like domain-containing protein [Rhizophagus irregularis DAOM 181602=DAOM 197198]